MEAGPGCLLSSSLPARACLLLCVSLALTLSAPCSPLSICVHLSQSSRTASASFSPVRQTDCRGAELCLCWVGVQSAPMGTAPCRGSSGPGVCRLKIFLEVSKIAGGGEQYEKRREKERNKRRRIQEEWRVFAFAACGIALS